MIKLDIRTKNRFTVRRTFIKASRRSCPVSLGHRHKVVILKTNYSDHFLYRDKLFNPY